MPLVGLLLAGALVAALLRQPALSTLLGSGCISVVGRIAGWVVPRRSARRPARRRR